MNKSEPSFNHHKYRAVAAVDLPDRRWPGEVISKAPQWCSVDLRDGNQALIEPMTVEQKLEMFTLLVQVGFKEIEIGFPAASQTEFDFARRLIEENRIPDDVTIQVLTQAREELIARSYEALLGARKAIVHVYNSTSTIQREQVFGLDRDGIKTIAVNGARQVRDYAAKYPATDWQFQYSPESFTGTELDFAADVCNAVIDEWAPTPDKPVIINLPATVEVATPNVYADQVEWMCRQLSQRDAVRISLHTHNDRGCAVAAAELAVMAGADRVEGTLLGNGERTGNMDIVTMAMNLYSQGIDPQLDLSNMDAIIRCVEHCTDIQLHPRHPYAGELVYTAFSGSHQDAINKCLGVRKSLPDDALWDVAYLPIDPADLGRSYQEVIRINSQSGKGGVAYLLEKHHGVRLPRWLQVDFSPVIQSLAEISSGEVSIDEIWRVFQQSYVNRATPFALDSFELQGRDSKETLSATLRDNDGALLVIRATGEGTIDAFIECLQRHTQATILLLDYSEHALASDAAAEAVCYVQLSIDGQRYSGVGMSTDIVAASLHAILSAANQSAVFERLRSDSLLAQIT